MEGNSASSEMVGKEDKSIASEENPAEKEERFQDLVIKKMSEIQQQLSDVRADIRFSVKPNFLEFSSEVNDLIELAIELWRMENKIGRISPSLTSDQKESLDNSLNKLKRYLDKNDIEVLDHANQKYDEGQNLEILAVEKDPNITEPTVKETKEPTVLHKGQVVHIGKVIIASNE